MTPKDTRRLNVELTKEQRDFLDRENEATGVGRYDLLRRLLEGYMEEPPVIRAMRRDKSLTREDRIALWEMELKREREMGRGRRRGK